MKDQISALVDGELGEAECARLCSQLKTDQQLRQAWDDYHRVGDALRGHVAPTLCARVAAELAAEPTVLAPQPRRAARLEHPVTRWALPAAASVAAVALVAWMAVPTFFTGPAQVAQAPAAPIAQTGAPATPPLAAGPQVASTPTGPASRADAALSSAGVRNYLLAHQRYSPANAMQGVAPYARTVSSGGDER